MEAKGGREREKGGCPSGERPLVLAGRMSCFLSVAKRETAALFFSEQGAKKHKSTTHKRDGRGMPTRAQKGDDTRDAAPSRITASAAATRESDLFSRFFWTAA
ncbi:hypothetical protein [Pandoravirus japonicus]|uniref:Uncharacterized protein n=1 Tax=Pandoravirus japonicus TaxID=2823154 RepID=A0A811BNZ3_9VIRU|nr:hypothetical protein [Pandoravirus japonicus]